MLCGDSLDLADRRGKERVVRDAVGFAWQPGRSLVDRLDGGWLEERQLTARELEAMSEVWTHLVACEPSDVGAHDDALCERVECGHAHAAPQFRMTDQHEREPILGVHGVVGQKPQILE